MNLNVDDIIKLADQYAAERAPLENTWRDCFDMTSPLHGFGLNGQTGGSETALTDANSRKAQKYDDTLYDAARLLTSTIMGGMTPANSQWLELDSATDPEKRHPWFDEAANIAWREITNSNFDSEGFDFIFSSIIAGWAPIHTHYDADNSMLRFEAWTIGQTYLGTTKPAGAVDIVIRRMSMTPQQVVKEYGNASATVQEAARQNSSNKVDVIQIIYPRDTNGPSAQEMPYASVHIERATKHTLRDSGFQQFPLAIPRWWRIPGSAYGVGPVYAALDTAKSLNQAVRMVLQNAEMAMAGMYWAVDDGVTVPANIQIKPHGIIPVSSRDSFGAIEQAGNFNVAVAEIQAMQSDIRRIMMVSEVLPPQDVNMTATEYSGRLAVFRQMMGPIYGRLQAEWLQPLVARVIPLLIENGKIPPVPQELIDDVVNIRFVSPLARSQRYAEVQAMREFEADLMNAAQVNPELMMVYKWDEAQREKSWLLGVPQKFVKTKDEYKADVEAMKEQQQQHQQAMMEAQAAGVQQ